MIQHPDLYVVCECRVMLISVEVVSVAVQSTPKSWAGDAKLLFSSPGDAGCSCVTDLPVETFCWILNKPNRLIVPILVLSELKCLTGNMLLVLSACSSRGAVAGAGTCFPPALPDAAWTHFCLHSKGLCQAQSI